MAGSEQVVCPGCQAVFAGDGFTYGQEVQCYICGTRVTVRGGDGRSSPGEAAVDAAVEPGTAAAAPPARWAGALYRPERIAAYEPAANSVLGALRDPLQREPTPYDILGVSPSANNEDIEAAFKRAFAAKGAVQARKQLRDSLGRAEANLRIYNEAALGRMSPNPLQDPECLHPGRRAETGRLWELQFRKDFPDPGTAHCLAVFWHWWADYEEERFLAAAKTAAAAGIPLHGRMGRAHLVARICEANGIACAGNPASCAHDDCPFRSDCGIATPPPVEMWQNTIRYWAMLEAEPMFWQGMMGISEEDGAAIGASFVDRIGHRILDRFTEYATIAAAEQATGDLRCEEIPGISPAVTTLLTEQGFASARAVLRAGVSRLAALQGLSGAQASTIYAAVRKALGATDGLQDEYRFLAAMLDTERKTAHAIAKAAMKTPHGRVRCGALMLRHLGLVADIKAKIDAALQHNQSDRRLRHLSDVLSSHYDIVLLLESNRPSEALEAIARLPDEEQASRDVARLRMKALHLLAKEEASLGQVLDALETWEGILAGSECDGMRDDIVRDVIEICQKRANALQKHRRDEAIDILRTALALTKDDNLRLLLAELLTQRGIDAFRKGQELAEKSMPDAFTALQQKARAAAQRQDWNTAVEALRAAISVIQQQAEASKQLEQEAIAQCESGIRDLEAAAAMAYARAQENLQQAREAIDTMRKSWVDVLRQNLAVCLSNRAIKRVNDAQTPTPPLPFPSPATLAAALRASEQDLLESLSLAPDSEFARNNLAICHQMMTQLHLPHGRPPVQHTPVQRPQAPPQRPAPARSVARAESPASRKRRTLAIASFGGGLLATLMSITLAGAFGPALLLITLLVTGIGALCAKHALANSASAPQDPAARKLALFGALLQAVAFLICIIAASQQAQHP